MDFSPNHRGWITREDPQFFDACLKISEDYKIPIFLGVHRTRKGTAEEWLGLAKYRKMAVDLRVPWRTDRVHRRVESNDPQGPLPTLSTALTAAFADPIKKPLPRPPQWIKRALKNSDEEFLVNYSKLEQLQTERLPLSNSSSITDFDREFLEGKMVIIARVRNAGDKFNVPGRERPIEGAYVHACAVHTLAAEPLYEFRGGVRLVLDVLIGVAIIGIVTYIRSQRSKEENDRSWRRLQSKFIFGAVLVVIFAGIFLVRWLGVMWLDFLLVIFALLLHPSVEEWFESFLRKKNA